jgi:hypothetical protein
MVFFKAALERLKDLIAVLGIPHVDEIDDDDAAEISDPKLPGNRLSCLKIGLEDGFFQIPAPDKGTGVDVDGRHRLGLVENEIAPGFERHSSLQRPLDFILDAIKIKQRPLARIVFEPC